jgi:hypothetical protein
VRSAKYFGHPNRKAWDHIRPRYPFAGEFCELRTVAFSKPIWIYGVSRDQGNASCSTPLNRV